MPLISNIPRCCEQIYIHLIRTSLGLHLFKEHWNYPHIKISSIWCWYLMTSSGGFLAPFPAGSASLTPSPSSLLLLFPLLILSDWPFELCLIPLVSPASKTLSCLWDWWTDLSQCGASRLLPGSDRPSPLAGDIHPGQSAAPLESWLHRQLRDRMEHTTH